MRVKAREGLKVEKEPQPKEFITDSVVATVPSRQYYRKLIAKGDLILVSEQDHDPQPEAEETEQPETEEKPAKKKKAQKAGKGKKS